MDGDQPEMLRTAPEWSEEWDPFRLFQLERGKGRAFLSTQNEAFMGGVSCAKKDESRKAYLRAGARAADGSARYFGSTRSHTSSMVSPLVSVPL